jgi:hypothetical protein
MGSGIEEDDGYMRKCSHQIEIRVQSLSLNQDSACGLEITIREASGIEYMCRLGGMVRVNDVVLGLTTAHAIRKPCLDNALNKNISDNEPLFILDSLCKGHENTVEARSNFSAFATAWSPTTLWLAGYGALPSSSGQISSHSSITLDEDMCDFALLQIDFGNHQRPRNTYRNELPEQHVEQHPDEMKGRAVDVVCSYNDVRSGWLLPGERVIASDIGCWKTRKIQLQKPLGKIMRASAFTNSSRLISFPRKLRILTKIDRGFSGTWVVSSGEAIGMIVAVYENEPYVHMLSMGSVFSSVRKTLLGAIKDPEVRILSTVDSLANSSERLQARSRPNSHVDVPAHTGHIPIIDKIPVADSGKERRDNHDEPDFFPYPLGRSESLLDILC